MKAALPANFKLGSETNILLHPEFESGIGGLDEDANHDNRIFALALHKAPAPGIGRGFAHRVKDCHPRRMAQVRRGPNSRLPRIGWIGGGGRGDALAAVQCGA